MGNHLVDARELSALLNVPTTWVWRAARQGIIPHRRFGKYMRFDPEHVLAMASVGWEQPPISISGDSHEEVA